VTEEEKMAYSIKIKQEVVDHIHQGMSIKTVSQMYNISRQAISNWLNSQDHYLSETRNALQPYDLEVKVAVLRMIEAGDLSVQQIAELKNINLFTIRGWIKDKNRILALYSSQGQPLMDNSLVKSPGKEESAVSASDDKDTKQHIRNLKDENEFLKAKVAYLETLMEISGTPAVSFKKKHDTKPLTKSSEPESDP
jgi:transposase